MINLCLRLLYDRDLFFKYHTMMRTFFYLDRCRRNTNNGVPYENVCPRSSVDHQKSIEKKKREGERREKERNKCTETTGEHMTRRDEKTAPV